MKKIAIIVAGGKGTRIGGPVPKQFQLLRGKPVIWHSIKAFVSAYKDIDIVLVVPVDHIEKGKEIIAEFPSQKIQVTEGGETRFQSVKNGLKDIEAGTLVFVHDAVRCLVTPALIQRCGNAALKKGNAVPAVAATDTIRIETNSGNELIDRNKVKMIQTPQVFPADILKKAFDQPYSENFTDEATVVETSGISIELVKGEKTNIKITTPIDLMIAEKMLQGWC